MIADTPFNEHVTLAQAMLHGHLWIANVPSWMEHFTFGGRTYLVQPPGPALLLLPFVWWFGSVNQVLASMILGGLTIALLATIVEPWLVVFFALGTIYGWMVLVGNSWAFALTASVPFTLIAIVAVYLDRPLLAGMCAGVAALMRYDLVLAWPFYAIMLRRQLWEFELGLLPGLVTLAWFNWARFGNPFTTDLAIYASQDPNMLGKAPFSLSNLTTNLNMVLFMPPYLNNVWPYLHPHFGGQAIVWTSPAFISALRTRWSLKSACLWGTVLCASIPSLIVYADGYVQFGARYFIQIYPFLFTLMVLHAREWGLDQLDKLLICASIFFVCFGAWHIHYYSWGW